ncbi:MAG: O-methyltransferase [Pseudonocardiaceae bacterium]
MNDAPASIPPLVQKAHLAAASAEFIMSCTPRTGVLLRTLAASKPGGNILELGTGAGVGSAWLLAGMNPDARLHTVEAQPTNSAIARSVLMDDPRITLHCLDAQGFLDSWDGPPFDLAFVDCRPGKFYGRAELVELLAPGGLYVVEDLLLQATWPADHQPRVDSFLGQIGDEPDLYVTQLQWDSGLIIAAKI